MKRYFIFILLLCLYYTKGIAQVYMSWQDFYGNIWKYEYYKEDSQSHSQTIKIVSLDFSNPDNPMYWNEIPDSIDGYAVAALGPIFQNKYIYGEISLPKTVIELDGTFQNTGISRIINTEQIESIRNAVFKDCWNLDTINLPNCTNLGWEGNFYGCSNLKSVKLPKIQKLTGSDFYGCELLDDIELGNVTEIPSSAFQGCTSLQNFDLKNITSIGYSAFEGCTSLQNINLKSITSIGYSAFEGCTSLQNADLNQNITSIGDRAFANCPFLTKIDNIDFPNCTVLGADVFAYSKNLKEVKLAKCQTIGEGAFRWCNQLNNIYIPIIKSLGTDAFSGCQINQLSLPESIETLGAQDIPYIVINATNVPKLSNRFGDNIVISVPKEAVNSYKNAEVWKENAGQIFAIGTKMDYDVKTTAEANAPGLLQQLDRNNLNSIVTLKVSGTINGYDIMLFRNKMDNLHHLDLSDADIVANPYEYVEGHCTEDSILGDGAFSNLNKLISIKLPNSVKKINWAFVNCKNLESVSLPQNLKQLSYFQGSYIGSFSGCSRLTNVEFKSCETIDGYAFYNCSSLGSITLPNNLREINNRAFKSSGVNNISFPLGLKSIGEEVFEECYNITKLTLPKSLEDIGNSAFNRCMDLKAISFPPSLKSIGSLAFYGCNALDSINLPGLSYIGYRAFASCSNIKELRVPSTLEKIEDEAFSGCNLEKIYAYTVLPISISQNTFDNYSNIALYVPTQSVDNYYLNTQWSQFKEIHEFNEPYKYFYLDKEFTLDEKRFDGTPDIDIKQDGGLTVDGKDKQEAGDITIKGDGDNGNSGTLITDGNVNAKKMKFEIQVTANKWYFFSFPFDIKFADTKAPGEYKWKRYDGSIRADQGFGGWVDIAKDEEYLKQGVGYIFQTNQEGILTLSVTKDKFGELDANNVMKELDSYPSGNNFDASWNFIGNPQTSYFNVNDLGYQAPITVWNGNSYEAVRPGDDDYTLHPFEAFFVQKPTAVSGIEFKAEDRLTKTGSVIRAQETKARRIARGITPNRLIINLSVSDGKQTDKTRVVFNNQKSRDYEMDCDAAKFMTLTAAPQLYSIEGKGTQFAINERPMGSVQLGFSAKKAGTYTISAARMDQPMLLKDNQAGVTFDLTNGDYEFTSGAGTFNTRFMLIANGNATGIADIVSKTGVNIMPTDEGLSINGANGKTIDVYNLNGMQVATRNSDGMLNLPTGVYIVKVEGMSSKVMVK